MEGTERNPDTVEFVVSEKDTVYVVTNGELTVESRPGAERLEHVDVYAEGELVASYDRGDLFEEDDARVIVDAAKVAGVELDPKRGMPS